MPFVVTNHVYQPQIQVFWAAQPGLPVDHYEVYVDGAGTATASVTTNVWTHDGRRWLTAKHPLFPGALVTTDDRRSPLSPATSATTWSGIQLLRDPGGVDGPVLE